jgi:hypothetical protein
LKHVLRQVAIPHQAHAYREEDRRGFIVKGPESLAIARGTASSRVQKRFSEGLVTTIYLLLIAAHPLAT